MRLAIWSEFTYHLVWLTLLVLDPIKIDVCDGPALPVYQVQVDLI